MGLFDNDNNSRKGEVRIGLSEEKEGSKLKEDVESKLDNVSSGQSSSSDVSLEDIHRQNEKIIGLLEEISDQNNGSEDKKSSGQVNNVGDGMNELL